MPKFLSRYQNYLKCIYQRSPESHDDKLSISPCGDFIKLALVHKDHLTHNNDPFTKSTLHGGVDEILATKTPLEMDALVTPGSQLVLVEGPPGIGKSTLCWELCRKWDTMKSLQDFKIVLLLKLRERRVQNATSLHELFYHDDKRLYECIVDLVLSCDGEGVLLVLDGFDEMPRSLIGTENSLLMRLLKGVCLPRATRLVTSRPSALHCKNSFAYRDYRHVEILGFDDEHKLKFAEITFKSKPVVLDRFVKFILCNPIIKSLMYIPVNCAIIAQVYKELPDIKISKTMTQLYTLLVLVLIRRHLIKTGRWTVETRVPDNLEGLPEDIKADLVRVSELAYKGLVKKDVQVMFTDEEVGDSFQHLGLLNETKEMYVFKGALTYYFFPHLSMQEFLAAWYVSGHPEVADYVACTLLDDNTSVKKHFLSFGRFLSGNDCHAVMISALGSHIIHRGVSMNYFLMNYFLSCCYEAQDASFFEFHENPYILIDTPLDMYMFGYALVHASAQWYVRAATSFDMLVSSLNDYAPNGLVLGSVVNLQLLYNLDFLPELVQNSVRAIQLDDNISPFIFSFVNLYQVGISLKNVSSQAIQCLWYNTNLKNLIIDVYSIVNKETLQDLCHLISRHASIEKVQCTSNFGVFINSITFLTLQATSLWMYQKLIQAALSNQSLKHLTTNIPFTTSRNFTGLEDLTYNIGGYLTFSKKALIDCLCCVARMCEFLPSAGIFCDECIVDYLSIEDFIALLNNSLQCNTSLTVDSNCLSFPVSRLNSLSRALRKDPDVACMNLRRSKSLIDVSEDWLSMDCITEIDQLMRVKSYLAGEKIESTKGQLVRQYSCPDLLELQSLCNMHPQLHQIIGLPPATISK